jgi:uncharacterized protein YjiS (DUF1127 family)
MSYGHRSLAGADLRPSALRALTRLETWLDRIEQRHALRHLPEAALRDVALTRADADREAEKPFWQS